MCFKASSAKDEIFAHVRMEAAAVIHLEGLLLERITTLRVTPAVSNSPTRWESTVMQIALGV